MSDGKEDGIQVLYKDETIWATQKAMAELFEVGVPAVSKHLKNIFESGELDRTVTVSKMETVVNRGFRGESKEYVEFYNLDAVIAVGYRINSVRATQFRQWCTYVLRQFAIRGYVIDRKRMENGSFIGEDYFEHLLAEIREIRLSERRFYQKLTDIYATAIDYNRSAPMTRLFYQKVQNKMHYAVHGHTAAELIVKRADASKEHMGLTTWENAPDGKIVKPDVSVAKNYLKGEELEDMSRLVNAVLDMAERMANRHVPMTMEDWAKRIDMILEAGGDAVLDNAGHISAEFAKQFAEAEFEKYRVVQDKNFTSDFDRFLSEVKVCLMAKRLSRESSIPSGTMCLMQPAMTLSRRSRTKSSRITRETSRTGTQVGQSGDGMPPEGAISVAGVPPFCRTMGLRFPRCSSVRNAACSSGMTV